MAPDCLAISCPCWNRIKVGMPVIENCPADCGAASVSSLARIMRGDSWPAALANSGAIMRHGPHHEAQKSTRTGSWVRVTNLLNDASVKSIGCVGSSTVLHFAQIGPSCSLVSGTRFTARHWWQTTFMMDRFPDSVPSVTVAQVANHLTNCGRLCKSKPWICERHGTAIPCDEDD